jgi:O-antigen/teichoic acid export membrane protein
LPAVWLAGQHGKLTGAIFAMALVSGATFFFGHIILRQECQKLLIPISYNGGFERGVLSTTLSLWMSTLLLTGSTWAINMLLSRQPAGEFELGLLNAADKWKVALLFLSNVMFQVIVPMLSHSHATGQHGVCSWIVSRSLIITAAGTGLGAALLVPLAGPLMSMFGKDFTRGASVLTAAAFVAVVAAVYSVGSGVLWALGKPKLMLSIDVFRTVLVVGMCAAGLAASARGVMIAQFFAFSGGCVAVLWFASRQLAPVKLNQVCAEMRPPRSVVPEPNC